MARRTLYSAIGAAALALASQAEAGCLCVYDARNHEVNLGELAELKVQTIESLSQTVLQRAIRDTIGPPGPVGSGSSGPLHLSESGRRVFFDPDAGIPGLPGIPTSSPVSLSSLDGVLWGNRMPSLGIGDGAQLMNLNIGDPALRAALEVGVALLGRGVGQSGTWGRALVPRFDFLGSMAPQQQMFSSLPSAAAWTRQVFQRPSLGGANARETAELIDSRRQRLYAEAPLDAMPVALHGLRASAEVNRRVDELNRAAKGAPDLRTQVSVLQSTVSALLEEAAGTRAILASMLQLMASRDMAAQPVSIVTPGSSAIPGMLLGR